MAETIDHFEACKAIAQGGVEAIAKTFTKPDDDFMPAFIYIDGGGKGQIVGMNNSARDDEESDHVKTRLARFMEMRLRQDRALVASLMVSAWSAMPPEGTTREQVERGDFVPRKMANRREVLWLQITDGRRYEVYEAPLIRHPGAPPTVGEWVSLPHFVKESTGRFQLHRLFQRALGMRDEAQQT